MRTRFLGLAAASLVAAGCGSGTLATGGQATSSAPPAASTSAAAAPASSAAGSAGASTPATGAAAGTSPACQGAQAPPVAAGSLTGLEFVSADQGWAVGQDTILATTDGGAHWTAQLSGKLNLTSADFISGQDGWAVGTTSLLATTDGGAHWTALPEPCPVIRSVHFVSPSAGFAVAGGQNAGGANPEMPVLAGVVLTTDDGGRTWRRLATPANAQTVCFSDAQHGWLGAGGLLYRTSDGGKDWTVLTSMAGAARVRLPGPDERRVRQRRFRLGAAHGPGRGDEPGTARRLPRGPGGRDPDLRRAVLPDSRREAGRGVSRLGRGPVLRDRRGKRGLRRLVLGVRPWHRPLGHRHQLRLDPHQEGQRRLDHPAAGGQFPVTEVGWVAGNESVFPTSAKGTPKSQERIVATTDGGRTWHLQYAGPWTS